MIRNLIKTDVFKDGKRLYLRFVEGRTTSVYYFTYQEAEIDECGTYLCELDYLHDKWRIGLKDGGILPDSIRRMRFDKKEAAAQFCLAFKLNTAEEIAKHPLSDSLTNYLERRARDVVDEEKEISNRLLNIIMEKGSLRYLAKKYNLEQVKWDTEGSDKQKIVQDLLAFKIGDVRFFSEAYLYEAIGKEDARTVLALVRNVIRLIDSAQQFKV